MRLTIENEEEAQVAAAAIEELRERRIRHVGLHHRRMELECEQTVRERAFSQRWIKDNSGRRPPKASLYDAMR